MLSSSSDSSSTLCLVCGGTGWAHCEQCRQPHNLELVHPTQDRVLSIRKNARYQVR